MLLSGERDFSARLTAAGAIAADAIDEERVAAIVLGDDTIYLVRGPVKVDSEWSDIVDIGKVEATRIQWPVGLVWKKGDKSLYNMAEAHGSGILLAFVPTIEANEHGTAIASVSSGVIAVVRPGSTDADFAFHRPRERSLRPSKDGSNHCGSGRPRLRRRPRSLRGPSKRKPSWLGRLNVVAVARVESPRPSR